MTIERADYYKGQHDFRWPVSDEDVRDAHLDWRGTHMGVTYEVAYWGYNRGCDGAGTWNYYLLVPEAMIPDRFSELWLDPVPDEDKSELLRRRVYYRYDESILRELHWHGGITFYEKTGGLDGTARGVKVGCDYAHLFDRHRYYDYDLREVSMDAMRSCERFRELFPTSLYRCVWDGTYHPLAAMVELPNRAFKQRTLHEQHEREKAEREASK